MGLLDKINEEAEAKQAAAEATAQERRIGEITKIQQRIADGLAILNEGDATLGVTFAGVGTYTKFSQFTEHFSGDRTRLDTVTADRFQVHGEDLGDRRRLRHRTQQRRKLLDRGGVQQLPAAGPAPLVLRGRKRLRDDPAAGPQAWATHDRVNLRLREGKLRQDHPGNLEMRAVPVHRARRPLPRLQPPLGHLVTVTDGCDTLLLVPDLKLTYEQPPEVREAGRKPRSNMIGQLHLLTIEPKERWGQWIRLNTYEKGTVASAAAQKLRRETRLPNGRFEFRSGRLDDGAGYGVWARYMGPKETA